MAREIQGKESLIVWKKKNRKKREGVNNDY